MNNTIPLLSIVMATYNGEEFLSQQIESIFNQSYQDFELIICDDKSNDKTVDIIYMFMKKYSNIKLYQNVERLGVVKNFEKVIGLSKSKYIALSDQDDIWVKDKLKILIKEIKKEEDIDNAIPLMVHSDLQMMNENNQILNHSFLKFKNYNLKKTKDLNHIIGPCGVMGNTILMNEHLKNMILPFPNHLDIHDYWIAIINEMYGKRITIKQPLVQYRIHQNNLSNSLKKYHKSKLEKIKQIMKFDCSLPYMHLGREKVLRTLLCNKLSKHDRIIIESFLSYLEFSTNRLNIFYKLVKFNLIKKGFLYRLKLLIRILFAQKCKD